MATEPKLSLDIQNGLVLLCFDIKNKAKKRPTTDDTIDVINQRIDAMQLFLDEHDSDMRPDLYREATKYLQDARMYNTPKI